MYKCGLKGAATTSESQEKRGRPPYLLQWEFIPWKGYFSSFRSWYCFSLRKTRDFWWCLGGTELLCTTCLLHSKQFTYLAPLSVQCHPRLQGRKRRLRNGCCDSGCLINECWRQDSHSRPSHLQLVHVPVDHNVPGKWLDPNTWE